MAFSGSSNLYCLLEKLYQERAARDAIKVNLKASGRVFDLAPDSAKEQIAKDIGLMFLDVSFLEGSIKHTQNQLKQAGVPSSLIFPRAARN